MENVAKKFRAALPAHLTVNSCVSAQAALNVCRERIFRVVLIDNEIPDVDSSVLMNQLRVLQPHATFLALALRSVNKVQNEMKELGFDDVLFKPFMPEAIDDLLARYFDNQELLIKEDNVLKVAAFTGRAERMERYYTRVSELLSQISRTATTCREVVAAVAAVATAVHDEAVRQCSDGLHGDERDRDDDDCVHACAPCRAVARRAMRPMRTRL